MDGKFQAFVKGDKTCVVQTLANQFREDEKIRIALRFNGKDPEYINGGAKPSETRWVTEAQWNSRKKTKKAQPV